MKGTKRQKFKVDERILFTGRKIDSKNLPKMNDKINKAKASKYKIYKLNMLYHFELVNENPL